MKAGCNTFLPHSLSASLASLGKLSIFLSLGIADSFKSDLDHFLLHQKQIGCFSSQLLLCHSSSIILEFRAADLWKCS